LASIELAKLLLANFRNDDRPDENAGDRCRKYRFIWTLQHPQGPNRLYYTAYDSNKMKGFTSSCRKTAALVT